MVMTSIAIKIMEDTYPNSDANEVFRRITTIIMPQVPVQEAYETPIVSTWDNKEFAEAVVQRQSIMLGFVSADCAECSKFKEVFNEFAFAIRRKQNNDVKFILIDTSVAPKIVARYALQRIPAVVYIDHGRDSHVHPQTGPTIDLEELQTWWKELKSANVMDDIPDWSAVEFARAMKVFPNIILEVVSTETPCSECDTYDKIFQQFAVVMNVMNERIPLARVNVEIQAILPTDELPAIVYIGNGGSTIVTYKRRDIDATSLWTWWQHIKEVEYIVRDDDDYTDFMCNGPYCVDHRYQRYTRQSRQYQRPPTFVPKDLERWGPTQLYDEYHDVEKRAHDRTYRHDHVNNDKYSKRQHNDERRRARHDDNEEEAVYWRCAPVAGPRYRHYDW